MAGLRQKKGAKETLGFTKQKTREGFIGTRKEVVEEEDDDEHEDKDNDGRKRADHGRRLIITNFCLMLILGVEIKIL